MRPVAKRFLKIGVLFLVVPALLSGCIVCVDDVFCDNRPPRMATLHVYARDYFTGTPIPWARVELYESDWWSWDYQGTWPMSQAGYVGVPCGYMYLRRTRGPGGRGLQSHSLRPRLFDRGVRHRTVLLLPVRDPDLLPHAAHGARGRGRRARH